MGIQSSINSLLSQAQRLATFYKGFDKVGDFIKGQEDIVKGQEAQTEATKSLQESFENKKREEFYREMFDYDGKLTRNGETEARFLESKVKRGIKLDSENNEFYNNPAVQDYLKTFNDKNARFESALNTLESSISPELKNKVAGIVARASVEARTDSINKTKSNFDEHVASLIKKYGKGSGNP